jgi:hypothetical protein
MVYAEGLGDDWCEWSAVKDSDCITTGEGGGEDTEAVCFTLYTEASGEEALSLKAALAMVEDGTITDETQIYCDEEAFPFGDWTAWSDCSYVFGVGQAPDGCAPVCFTLYTEASGEEALSLEEALAMVEDGTITDETQIYCDEEAFPFGDWTAWSDCCYVFGVGQAPDGCAPVCFTLYTDTGDGEEFSLEQAMEMLAEGTITDQTQVHFTPCATPACAGTHLNRDTVNSLCCTCVRSTRTRSSSSSK